MKLGALVLLTVFSLPTAARAEPTDLAKLLGLREAQKVSQGDGIEVAVLSTGINYHLPEFQGRLLKDAAGNYGYDAVEDSHEVLERGPYFLGSEMASLVAGNFLGLAPEAKILPVRIVDGNGTSSYEIIAKGVRYATSRKVNIISLSVGPVENIVGSQPVCEALKEAEAAGILLSLPAGNEKRQVPEWTKLCHLRSTVLTTGTDQEGKLAYYASWGFPDVQLAVPSVDLQVRSADGTLKERSGTSYAAAITAGAAALVWSAHPEYSAKDVIFALVRGSRRVPDLSGKVLANGMIFLPGALAAEVTRLQ